MASPATLGHLIRLAPLNLDELPPHPALTAQPSTSSRPGLQLFIEEILDQATSFVDDVLPRTFSPRGEKRSSPASAKVTVLRREIDQQQLSQIPWATGQNRRKAPPPAAGRGEAWFVRRSGHADQSRTGTASFAEFEHGLLVDHSEHEREYTPDVYDARLVVDWDAETARVGFVVGEAYGQVRMCGRHHATHHTRER